jgi:hypothetical protein
LRLEVDKPASLDDLRLFLYAKGILAHKSSNGRKIAFDELLDPAAALVTSAAREELEEGRARLARIVDTGEQASPEAVPLTFEVFCKTHPVWADKTKSYVVFRDHEAFAGKEGVFVERIQLSGLCYMHAPIVLQHYLVRMNSTEQVMMLDMGIYLRQYMGDTALYKHIWEDAGGDSVEFLKHILVQDSQPEISTPDSDGSTWLTSLKEHGPLLVSGAEIEDVFLNGDATSFCGGLTTEIHGRHAMVLVGHRRDSSGRNLFLLQNWWRRKVCTERAMYWG